MRGNIKENLYAALYKTFAQAMAHRPSQTTPNSSHPHSVLARVLGGLRGLSQCAICYQWPAERICGQCQAAYAAPMPRCSHCALLLPATQVNATSTTQMCAECLLHLRMPAVDSCVAAVSYCWPWQACINAFKFNKQPGLAGALAGLMASCSEVLEVLTECDVLVPVPFDID